MKLLNKPIAVTMGDPSGIGPEITVKAITALASSISCILIGDPLVLAATLELLKSEATLNIIDKPEDAVFEHAVLNLLASSHLSALPPVGKVEVKSGQCAYAAIIKAIDLANAGSISAIVTAPINKEALFEAGILFPGHTEILAKFGGVENVAMMLANDEIRTVLVTIHCSLLDAIKNADFDAQMRAINFAYEGGRNFGLKNPRIAVAGLNPHAGEGGLFGSEEETIIIPAIKKAQAMGMDVSGPWPGDTVFMQARKGLFDVVVAQYHDQGLIPVKYLGIENGVNITLGLPFIRTSPDHGTAFDIAGKGIAHAESIELAIKKAFELTQNKHQDNKVHMNSEKVDFIFMLTQSDKTVPDAHERLQDVLAGGAKHIGFKDVGLPFTELRILAKAIKEAGATLYLEVVSLDEESEIKSAEVAMGLDVDYLMGGTRPEVIAPIVKAHKLKYYPFPGNIVGHPSVLTGTVSDIVESAVNMAAIEGVDGLDLLAYRFDGDVPALMKAVCSASVVPVVMAGSIDTEERIRVVHGAGAAGFTVGTAAFNGDFPAKESGLVAQVACITSINQRVQV